MHTVMEQCSMFSDSLDLVRVWLGAVLAVEWNETQQFMHTVITNREVHVHVHIRMYMYMYTYMYMCMNNDVHSKP